MEVQLPLKKGETSTKPTLEFNQLVVIGANGAGKTRFGSDIEQRYNQKVHRISAQKSLAMPNSVGTKSFDEAESEFLYGSWDPDNIDWVKKIGWKSGRWGNNLNTSLLNDYEKLMVLLHTDEYEQLLNSKINSDTKTKTKFDTIKRIWEQILPHRKLKIKAGTIETYPLGKEASAYNASEMSDGERVIFYLIGEVICVPENSIIIIDEPEMHIHSSLIKPFFDSLEAERPDCAFIYLTHNIDFAFSRQNAKKVWAKSFEGNIWDYEILDENIPIPEQLYLDILGSRNPIIFIEGNTSSIDYELYEQVYDDKTLKPVGSCGKVIQIVKTFREQQSFHHIESFGIIDRDRRQKADIVSLNKKGVWVLDVAEAENLLLLEPVVKSVAEHMGKNPNDVFNKVSQNLIEFFSDRLDDQILLHYKEALRREFLTLSNFKANQVENAIKEIDEDFAKIDKQDIHDEIDARFRSIITNQDYHSILKVFNMKEALIPNSKVCHLTGINNKVEYKNIILTLLKKSGSKSDEIRRRSDRIRQCIDSEIIKGRDI